MASTAPRDDQSDGERSSPGGSATAPPAPAERSHPAEPPEPADQARPLLEAVARAAEAAARGDDPAGIGRFVEQYYAHMAREDLEPRTVEHLAEAALAHLRFARERAPGEALVRVRTPPEGADAVGHSIAEIVTDDMPFLVDSVSMELDRHGVAIHLLVHPIVVVTRVEGRLTGVLPAGAAHAAAAARAGEPHAASGQVAPGAVVESYIRAEFDRTSDPAELQAIANDLRRILGDVAVATGDWHAMVDALHRVVAELHERPAPVSPDDLEETRALLSWMADDHFTLLGYGEYDLVGEPGSEQLLMRDGTGLGILRDRAGRTSANSFARLPPDIRAHAYDPVLLTVTKANSRATVHRATYLDYVGVKRFSERGEVEGEWRFLGLWTSPAYRAPARTVPLLRRKVQAVLDRAGFTPRSHSAKDLEQILEELPRDELFQIDVDELYELAMGVLALNQRKRTKLFVRTDRFRRFVSALVYLPRERYTTATRETITELLVDAFGAISHEYQARVSESRLARLHVILRIDPAEPRSVDLGALEQRVVAATRTWTDDLRDALVARHGEERGLERFEVWREAFPVAYRADYPASAAVDAMAEIEALPARRGMRTRLASPASASAGELDFTLYCRGDTPRLSVVLPILAHMGAEVVDEHPYVVTPSGMEPVVVQRYGLRARQYGDLEGPVRRHFEECFSAVIQGRAENDGLNRLVLLAGLAWREIAILRAYSRYMRQTGSLFGQGIIADAVAANAPIARNLVELFVAKFDPRCAPEERAIRVAVLHEDIAAALDEVMSLDEDRILRALLALVDATVRTNWFAPDDPAATAVKLDPALVPDLPPPRPRHEIWVYSPTVEGVHLRAGDVARGGIRWSDRAADFRTEILGLMKAQRVKNAVIVPAGAKGGFVVKRPEGSERPAHDDVVAAYRALISALLDVTDNRVDGEVVTPAHVVRYDGDDTYIVAAADKGTATFSDIANEIALARGFWLGDAFASGGSVGYDHKKMGITARGAWESVRRHFRELGVDVQVAEITVVGIGDMSGDVFGNGMLLSDRLRLVAAFDHRHVFLDPDPDPAASFAERRRLFALPGSSWADYDVGRISEGGGVHARTAKSIAVTDAVRARLGIADGVTELTPNEMIKAILRAPVDLLWNGGIGTFVKATHERHADVGDKANDQTRIDASELRCRVVAEGGNLGLTQAARVEFALAGGLLNTDSIDNSGGVDASDHEVNIKIALDTAVRSGRLTPAERDELFLSMTDDVATLVLRTNYRQNRALANARAQAASMEDVHARLLRSLESQGVLDRAVEGLPDEEELAQRRASGLGLTGPELAVMLAYTKISLDEELRAGDVPDDPDFVDELLDYFPAAMHGRFREVIESHPLRRAIVSTQVVNRMVNAAGISFVFRMQEETGADVADITRAHRVARDIFDLPGLWNEIAALDNVVAADVQTEMYLEVRKLTERAARWLLRHRRRPIPVRTTLAFFGPGVSTLSARVEELLTPAGRAEVVERAGRLLEHGVPEPLARRMASLNSLYGALDIVDLALRAGLDAERVAAVYFTLGERLHLDWLTDRVLALPRDDRWRALARTALRDDAQAVHRELTSDVLAYTPVLSDPAQACEQWLSANAAVAQRALGVLADLQSHGGDDLHTLTVALRELRNLAQPG
jgi:glutamate dehydrogenase